MIAMPKNAIFELISGNLILESITWPITILELSLLKVLLNEESKILKEDIIKASANPEDIINNNEPNNCLFLFKDNCLYNLFRALNWLPVNDSKKCFIQSN